MLLRTAYIRRSRKSQRFQRRLAVVAMLGVAGCAALLFVTRTPAPPRVASDVSGIVEVPANGTLAQVAQAAAPAASKTVRRVYPYSIVPGGVAGRDDVVRVMKMDKVVADHYASFQVDKASAATVSKPRAVYVSYRKGDKVYWTAGKHTLAAGETVLTDGSSEIRGRCGNRISDVAMFPVEAKGPSEAELDAASEEAVDADEGGAENVSFTADGLVDGGGRAFALNDFYGAGLAHGSPERARGGSGGIGLPNMPDLADMMRIANSGLLLAAASQASGNGDTDAGGSAATPAAPGQGGTTGESSGGTGDPGNAGSGDGDNGGSTGGSGGGTGEGGGNPSTGPVIPAPQTPPQAPDGGLPEVLQPTQPIPVPSGSGGGKDDGNEVPEPGSLWLAGLGFAGLLAARRRRGG